MYFIIFFSKFQSPSLIVRIAYYVCWSTRGILHRIIYLLHFLYSTIYSGGSWISRGGGGHRPIGGGKDLRRGCFSVKTYAKTKEFGPIGHTPPLDPPMLYLKEYVGYLIINMSSSMVVFVSVNLCIL